MSEFLAYEPPDWAVEAEIERRVQAARQMTEEPYKLGTITVSYDCDDHVYGGIWVRGVCLVDGAEMVMRASDPSHLRHLALTIVRYECWKRGHNQDYDALVLESAVHHPGDESE